MLMSRITGELRLARKAFGLELEVLKRRARPPADEAPVLQTWLRVRAIFIAISAMFFFPGCADVREELTTEAQRLPELFAGATTSEGFWRGDNVRGAAKIVVHVGEQ